MYIKHLCIFFFHFNSQVKSLLLRAKIKNEVLKIHGQDNTAFGALLQMQHIPNRIQHTTELSICVIPDGSLR